MKKHLAILAHKSAPLLNKKSAGGFLRFQSPLSDFGHLPFFSGGGGVSDLLVLTWSGISSM